MRRKNPYILIVFQYILFSFFAIVIGFAGSFFIVKVMSINQFIAKIPRTLNIFERANNDTEVYIQQSSTGRLGLRGEAYIVKRLDTGEILYEHNAEKIYPIASITKLVTAVVAQEALDLDSRVIINDAILATEGVAGNLRRGESLRVRELMYPLLMVSSNDAAEAIARTQSRSDFIALMNRWVRSIGATQTTFADPSGLSPRNTSSANDVLAILEKIVTSYDGILDITKLKTFTVRTHLWRNPTSFLNLSQYRGGKNGYTEEADRTAALLFDIPAQKYGDESGTVPVAVVILKSSDRSRDVLKVLETLEKDFGLR